MGRIKTESENENCQSKAGKAIDKDASSDSQSKSEVTKPVENDKKKEDEQGTEKTSPSSGHADVQTAAKSNQESSSAPLSKEENEMKKDVNESKKEDSVEPSAEVTTSQQTTAAMVVPEVIVKRGRGRPRKYPTKIESPKPKRGRGRPPKSLSQKASYGTAPGLSSIPAADRKVSSEQMSEIIVKNEAFTDCEETDKEQNGNYSHSAVNGDTAAQRKSRSLPFRKSKRRSIPRINLEDFEDDSDEEPVRKKRSTKPKRFPPSGPRLKITAPSTSKKPRGTEQHLTAQVDRLASLVDRLENRINLDGLVDEDTDIETDLEEDVQVLLLQRNYNVKNELKRDFKDIVKGYIEELGAESGCLIASTRSYKNSGKFTVYEIWNSESDQMIFFKKSVNKIFSNDTSNMLKTNLVVKTMNIPASWWQKCS